jgi:hypothetical protein
MKRVAACDWAFNNGLIFVDEIQHFCETELKEISEIAEREQREIFDSVHHRFVGEDDDEPCLQCGRFDIEPVHQSYQSWSREVDSIWGAK